jgi:hypothetical protein
MLLAPGDKLAVAHRRLFAEDKLRWFIGAVDAYEQGIVRVTGYTWVQDVFAGAFVRKDRPTTKLLSLFSGGLLVYVLPTSARVEDVRFESQRDGSVWLTDGDDLQIDMTEGQRERSGG